MLIRKLDDKDASICAALVRQVGWNTTEARWRLLLSVGDAFGLELDNGELAGTVIFNRFDALAVIAMMFVSEAHQRRGFGRELLQQALKQGNDIVVYLFASNMGRPLYEQVGFIATSVTSVRLQGRASLRRAASRDGLRNMTAADIDVVCALDEEAQGCSRRRLLKALFASSDRALVVERGGEVVGFGLSSWPTDIRQVGPIVARTEEDARTLATELAADVSEPLCIDILSDQQAMLAWGQAAGLAVVENVPLMTLAGAQLPGRRGLIRSLAGRPFG
ncbi:GNAT family N-acetyltransferase [Sorangium cellulosum]|uniref:GNAT family N-acetyltransferase n=1 Tax=Sorangium cellulosum TaxID=56 RepID=UPI0009D70C77|nr:GNAT family N-acetyltransferase [Sorangium cellulosum]